MTHSPAVAAAHAVANAEARLRALVRANAKSWGPQDAEDFDYLLLRVRQAANQEGAMTQPPRLPDDWAERLDAAERDLLRWLAVVGVIGGPLTLHAAYVRDREAQRRVAAEGPAG